MTDSSAPPGNSTPSSKPTHAPTDEIVVDEDSKASAESPSLPPPVPQPNVTARLRWRAI